MSTPDTPRRRRGRGVGVRSRWREEERYSAKCQQPSRQSQYSVLDVSGCRSSKVPGPKSASGSLRLIPTRTRRNGPKSLVPVSGGLRYQLRAMRGLYIQREIDADAWALADFVNPKDLPEGKSIVDYLVEQTDGGLDYTYDATGVVRPLF